MTAEQKAGESMKGSNQIGKLIAYERAKMGISVEKLCGGLCSRSFLARVESGERACEKVLADALLQRIGISADKFTYVMNPDEQEWLLLREQIVEAVESGDKEQASALIKQYKKITEGKSILHMQMLELAEVVLLWKNGSTESVLMDRLCAAWKMTMPETSIEQIDGELLTLTEFIISMMYYRILEDRACIKQAMSGYEMLLKHLEASVDEDDAVKLYTQIAYRMILFYLKMGDSGSALELVQKAVSFLQRMDRMFYIRQFLEVIEEYGAISEEERKGLHEICHSFKWLYKKYKVQEETWIWYIPFGMSEIELCGNLIRSRREALGMSQEELAEGICEPVTISRIECGRVTSKRQVFKRLLERLGTTGSAFETVEQVENPKLFELADKIGHLLRKSKGEEAGPMIEELAQEMKQDNPWAKQFLLHVRALSLYKQEKLDARQHIEMQKEALFLTMPELSWDKLQLWCFSRREVSIINAISYSCDEVGERGDISRMLETVKNSYEKKPLSLEYYTAGYELTVRNLGNLKGNMGEYEKAIDVVQEAIRLGLKAGRSNVICMTLYDVGWNMEQLWKDKKYTKEESLPYIKTSYAISRVLGRESAYKFCREHIMEVYGHVCHNMG